MSENIMNDFIADSDITYQQILNSLLDGSKNLDLKTHIESPQKLAGLNILEKFSNELKLNETSRILRKFLRIYLRYMISYKRESRKEIVNAVRSMFESSKVSLSLSEKLTKNLNDV